MDGDQANLLPHAKNCDREIQKTLETREGSRQLRLADFLREVTPKLGTEKQTCSVYSGEEEDFWLKWANSLK